MSTFQKGPAQGHLLMTRRAPRFLRVAVGPGNAVRALEKTDDTPASNERLHCYEITGRPGVIFVNSRGGNVQTSGRFATAQYRYVAQQPADRDMRTNAAWQAWTIQAAAKSPRATDAR